MINQELLDYIKQQLQQGINREQIKSSLIANGWQEQDIEEGFDTINTSTLPEQYSNFSNKAPIKIRKIIIASLIGLVIIGGGVYFITQTLLKSKEKFRILNEATQQLSKETPANIATEKTAELRIIDCGTTFNFQKFDCFVNAAKNCSPAKIIAAGQADLGPLGLIVEGASFYELKGWQENKCVFYTKPISGKITYNQETIQKLLDGGLTNEQIKQQEQETSKTAQSTLGRDGICKFTNINNLINLLNEWQKGNFSSDDFKGIDCKGEYFGPGEQPVNTSKTITDQECTDQKGDVTAITSTGTACFKNQIDLGTIIGPLKIDGKYPQCCIQK